MTVTTPRVLLISESRITRRVVEMTFADQALDLTVATSGRDGLTAWSHRPAAVVLVDLTMEPPDGLAVATALHEFGAGAPVIAMAGQGEAVDDEALAAAGVRGVLRKPLDSLQLIDAVRSALRDGRRAVPDSAPWRSAHLPASDTAASRVAPPEVPAVPAAVTPPDPVGPCRPEPEPALCDADLERVAARVAAIWGGDVDREARVSALVAERVERVAPAAASEVAERLVRELAPAVVAEVARAVVADVSERLVREEIARMRAAQAAR